MSLPTPPSTSHRDKENRDKENRIKRSGSRVVWSDLNEYHSITGSPTAVRPPEPHAVKMAPKSILKKTSYAILPFQDVDINKRETTPEPEDPLSDPHYLQYPVSRLIAFDSSLRDLIEAYNILAVRIKATLAGPSTHASCALLQPFKKNAGSIVNAIVRDLGRAMEDPGSSPECPEHEPQEDRVFLPSPQSSPRRKRGMTADQVKSARDTCTTCHAVLKFLSVVFALEAVYSVFTGAL